jgi:hypothetical protein
MSRPVRTILAAIVLAALIVAGVAIVAPLVARPMIVAAIQGESPFGDGHLDIDVDCNVFGLLQGSVDRIHVRGRDLTRGDVTIGALDLTLTDVATSGHAFGGADGTLAALQVPIDDATSVTIDEVSVSGASSELAAIATLDNAAAVRLIASAFADGGVDVTDVQLANGTVAFQVFGARAEAPVGVEAGAIVLVDPFGQGSFEVVTPGSADAWQFTGAGVTPNGMTIQALVDAGRLLESP